MSYDDAASGRKGDKDRVLEVARERFGEAHAAHQEEWKHARDDLRFLTGEGQWDDVVLQQRTNQGRPTVTVPHLPRFINAIEGDLRQNRVSAKVAPREDGDKDSAEVIEGLIRTIEDVSDAPAVYSMAAVSAASCGMGFFRLSIVDDEDETFDKDLMIKRIKNPFAVLFDPAAEDSSCEDARYCFVREVMPRKVFEAAYPKADTSSIFGEVDGYDSWREGEDNVVVAEYWTCEEEEYELALLTDGSYVDAAMVPEEFESQIVEKRKKTRKKVQMRLITGSEVLEGPIDWPGRRIPIFPVWGREVHIGDKVRRLSLIRHAKDAQRTLNYARSAEIEAVALAPKVPYLVTDEMIAGREKEWAEANTGTLAYLTYTPDERAPGGMPMRQLPPQPSAAMYQLSAAAVQDMKDATGIYDASLGERSNETSGTAIRARQQEADQGTFVFLDNMRRAVRACAKEMVYLIPIIYDAPRKIRILGPDMADKVVAINQPDERGRVITFNGKYDLSITTGAAFGTRRAEAVAAMTQFIQAAPDAAKFVLDIIARNSDWPGAEELEERMKKLLPPEMLNDEDPRQQQIMMLQQQLQQAMAAMQQMQQAPEMRKAQAEASEAEFDTERARLETVEKAFEVFARTGGMQQMLSQAAQQGAMMALQAMQRPF